jgi:hypothetical protein
MWRQGFMVVASGQPRGRWRSGGQVALGEGGAGKVNRPVCRRLPSPSRKGRGRNLCLCLCLDLLAEPVDRGLRAALAVRDVQRGQGHFDDAEGAEDHWRIDVPHMSDAEGLAG